MHGDHLFGLPGVILHANTCTPAEDLPPLLIYGPYGLHEYVCTTLRLTHSSIFRRIIVYELVHTETDAKCLEVDGVGPWRHVHTVMGKQKSKSVESVTKDSNMHTNTTTNANGNGYECEHIARVEIYSVNGIWNLVDDARVSLPP